jgi:hypothetical protein
MGAEHWSEFDTLRAELECAQVLTRFVGHLDRREYDLLLGLVTPDCIWRGTTDARGREQIRARLESRPADMITLHLITNIVVTIVDESSAEAKSYLCVHRFDGEGNTSAPRATAVPHTLGVYDDTLVRTDQSWRIAERRLTIVAQAKS